MENTIKTSKAMTLQEAKDQVARKAKYENWGYLYSGLSGTLTFEGFFNEASELYASSQSAALKEINRELSNQVNALRTSAHFQSDNDVEANLRNQVFRLQLEIEQLKAVNKELVEAERNKTIQEVIDLFKPLFEIEPKSQNIVQIALKVKEIYEKIERLKIDLKG